MPRHLAPLLAAFVVASAAPGCGAVDEPAPLGHQRGAIRTTNGLSTNGLSCNGLSTNGLSTNGLSTKSLLSSSFMSWWSSSGPEAATIMSYVVGCAMSTKQQFSFVAPDGQSYVWKGELGLAPTWSKGAGFPQAEQELVSACIGARLNRYGVHVNLSVRGFDGAGKPIPTNGGELHSFTFDEGCFFGNVFTGDGLWSGASAQSVSARYSSARACAFEDGAPQGCAPLVSAGLCDDLCTPSGAGLYSACHVNGKSFRPLSIFLQPSMVKVCGDGACEFPEQPYSTSAGTGCAADCGTVP